MLTVQRTRSAPPPALIPSAERRHLPELDGLRGLAVLAVMGYHFGIPGTLGGYLGVDVFFVLSGFVVMRALSGSSGRPGWVRRFFVRRAARLIPVLVSLLTFAVVWFTVDSPGMSDAEWAALGSGSLMSYNVGRAFFHADESLVHLWSLAVEWHFYLLAPLLVMGRFHRSRHRASLLVAAAALVVLVRTALIGTGAVGTMTAYLISPLRLDGLLLGTALALCRPDTLRQVRGWMGLAGLAVLGVLVAIGPAWYMRPKISLAATIPLGTLAATLVVASAAGGTLAGPVVRGLSARWLRWLGERSYSIYIWHYVAGVVVIAGTSEAYQGLALSTAMVCLSMATAIISYELVERPLREVINRAT